MKAFPSAALTLCVLLVAGCGGGNVNPPIGKYTPTPAVTPTPVPSPSPTVAPAGSTTSTVSLNHGAALAAAALATAVPAPAGYAQNVGIPLVTAAAGTTVTVTAATTVPTGLVALANTGRSTLGARRPAAASTYTTIFYDSMVPSANITASGSITFSVAFPASAIGATTPYYLGFYDTTQAAPAWQTIAGPVTASGTTLTFTGSISPITLAAGKLYGFAVFSSVVPTATPPPAPQSELYFGNDTALFVTAQDGTPVSTLAIPSQSFDLDDAGNIYAFDYNHGGTAPGQGGTPLLAEYPAGSASPAPIATYVPSIADRVFVAASGAGEVAAVHNVSSTGTLTTDVWDPGIAGAPSRSITTKDPSGIVAFAMTHDGTLYVPDRSAGGVPQFDVIPPGGSTPATVIPETIVPPAQYANFAPNYVAVGPDGTLYVTEYSFNQPDPNAGLYIYPLNGPERFVATATNAQGPGPQGVDVDASGNIYVVNDNTATTSNTTCQGDTLNSVTVYNSAGTLLRTIGGSFSGLPITVAADGTSFFASFKLQLLPTCAATGSYGIYQIAAGGSTATQISPSGSTEIVLFDGTHKTEPFSASRSTAGAHGSSRGGRSAQRRPGR